MYALCVSIYPLSKPASIPVYLVYLGEKQWGTEDKINSINRKGQLTTGEVLGLTCEVLGLAQQGVRNE